MASLARPAAVVTAPARAVGRRRWRQDPAGRRARILEVAGRLLARQGVRATPVRAIARAAGVSEGALYSYFPTKRALLEAVGERYGRGLAEAAFGALEGPLTPDAVDRVVANLFRYVRETDGPLAAFLLAGQPEEGAPAQTANRAQMLAAIEGALRRGIAQGVVAPCDVRVAAELQFGLVESALRDCFLRRGGAGEAATVREVVRCLRAYLEAPGGEEDTEPAARASDSRSR